MVGEWDTDGLYHEEQPSNDSSCALVTELVRYCGYACERVPWIENETSLEISSSRVHGRYNCSSQPSRLRAARESSMV